MQGNGLEKELAPRGNYFNHKSDLEPFPNPNLVSLNKDSPSNMRITNIRSIIERAKTNGLLSPHLDQLANIVWSHEDVFDTSFSSSPAKIKPLRIKLRPDAHPIGVKPRNYSQSQRAFMYNLMEELMRYNLIHNNPSSMWACAPLLVPKPGPEEWHFTVDLRPVKRFTILHAFMMIQVEDELTKTSGSTVYASVDFNHSYWKLPLHPDSQECQSFVTPENVFTQPAYLTVQLMPSYTFNLSSVPTSHRTSKNICC